MRPWLDSEGVVLYEGSVRQCLQSLPGGCVRTIVTSPPYWGLRDYGVPKEMWGEWEGALGMEPTPDQYVQNMVEVFRECSRALSKDGTLWLNIGDTYSSGGRATQVRDTMRDAASGKQEYLNGTAVRAARVEGLKPKDLVGIPWMLALALRADGWYLRQDIIWSKPNPMPESVTDRCTKAHEYLFLLSKSEHYYYDHDAIREPNSGHASGNGFIGRQGGAKWLPMPGGKGSAEEWKPAKGRNKRSVWTVPTAPYKGAHFATFPPALIEPCILAGSAIGDTVLDPFVGSGTTAMVARWNGRKAIGVDLNPNYLKMATERVFLPRKTIRKRSAVVRRPQQIPFDAWA